MSRIVDTPKPDGSVNRLVQTSIGGKLVTVRQHADDVSVDAQEANPGNPLALQTDYVAYDGNTSDAGFVKAQFWRELLNRSIPSVEAGGGDSSSAIGEAHPGYG